MHVLLILYRKFFWYSVLVIRFQFTRSIHCYDNYNKTDTRVAHLPDDYVCVAYYDFLRQGDNIAKSPFEFDFDNTIEPLPNSSAFCKIVNYTDVDNPKPVDEDLEAVLPSVKQGQAFCYCSTPNICNVRSESFTDYLSKAGPEERNILQFFSTIDNVTEVKEILEKEKDYDWNATSTTTTMSFTTRTTGTTGRTGRTGTTGTTGRTGTTGTTVPTEKKNDSRGLLFLIVVVALGILCIVLIIAIIALTPFIRKARKKRYRKYLERTWDERVRQAGLELEKQEEAALPKGRRRRDSKDIGIKARSKDLSAEGSRDTPSLEGIGPKKGGSKEGNGSKEIIGSKDEGGDDPFGQFVSKMGHMEQQPGIYPAGGGQAYFM